MPGPGSRNNPGAGSSRVHAGMLAHALGELAGPPAQLVVDFWSLAAQDQPLTPVAQQALLDDNERHRMASLRRPRDAQRYLAAHAGMRLRLAHWLAVENPGAARLAFSPHGAATRAGAARLRFGANLLGKPDLPDHPGWFFSLSHSDGHAMLALARTPVGADLERLLDPADLSAQLLQYILAPAESRQVALLPADRQPEAVTEHWVSKEAVMKACGLGLRLAPADVCFDRRLNTVQLDDQRCWPQQQTWHCRLLPAPAGYRAAIALPA
ncbi:MAG: 4'-phosphopantetheinyl transferase family protein [Janthinobacterium lividum]